MSRFSVLSTDIPEPETFPVKEKITPLHEVPPKTRRNFPPLPSKPLLNSKIILYNNMDLMQFLVVGQFDISIYVGNAM